MEHRISARQHLPFAAWIVIAAIAALAAPMTPASADDRPRAVSPPAPGAPARPAATDADLALWREECGACHVPYSPRLLPASDWRRLIATLDRHFGTDASLEPATLRRIETVLVAGARRAAAAPAPRPGATVAEPPRITTTNWFRREHDEVPQRVWKDARVGSPSRCEACHVDAAQGRFDESSIRMPR
jgi:hypothetical protein